MLNTFQTGSAFELSPSKEGFEKAAAAPALSTDSAMSTGTLHAQSEVQNDHLSWDEGDWVFDTINMVAEPVAAAQPPPVSPVELLSVDESSAGIPAPEHKKVKGKRHGSATGVSPIPLGDVEGVERSANSSSQRVVPGICQVDTCKADLSSMRCNQPPLLPLPCSPSRPCP